jgi:hypothetical protein
MFERCIGFAWCSTCRIYSGSMVHIPRKRVLVDALASLHPEERERLVRSETRLVEFLNHRLRGGEGQR